MRQADNWHTVVLLQPLRVGHAAHPKHDGVQFGVLLRPCTGWDPTARLVGRTALEATETPAEGVGVGERVRGREGHNDVATCACMPGCMLSHLQPRPAPHSRAVAPTITA